MLKVIHISYGGPDRLITDGEGKAWKFKDHPVFGPIVLNKHGDPAADQPGSRSTFWPAWACWKDQGKRLEEDGITCVWDAPQPHVVEHLGGNHYRHVSGDPEGDLQIVKRGAR